VRGRGKSRKGGKGSRGGDRKGEQREEWEEEGKGSDMKWEKSKPQI